MRRPLWIMLAVALPIVVSSAAVWAFSSSSSNSPAEYSVVVDPAGGLSTDIAKGDNIAGVSKDYVRPTPKDIPVLTADPDSKRLYESIRACFPDDARESYNTMEQKSCYEDLVDKAAETYNPVALINSVKALVAARPDLLTACHDGGHSASAILTRRFWSSSGTYDEQLSQMRAIMDAADDVCQNGYVHGFYDEIGKNNPNDDSFRAAGQVCLEMQRFGLDCPHGLGHTVWNATKDFEKAAAICGLFPGEMRYGCDDGVIMYIPDEKYRDVGPMNYDATSPGFDPKKFYNDAVKVCTWWPKDRPGDPEPLRGCWRGIVSGILWRPITDLNKHFEYDGYLKPAQELMPYAEQACIDLGPEGEEVCIREWPGMVIFMVENEPSRVEEFCSTMRKYKERCVSDTIAQMAQNKDFDAEISRRDAAD
jgi:hypothetical protein